MQLLREKHRSIKLLQMTVQNKNYYFKYGKILIEESNTINKQYSDLKNGSHITKIQEELSKKIFWNHKSIYQLKFKMANQLNLYSLLLPCHLLQTKNPFAVHLNWNFHIYYIHVKINFLVHEKSILLFVIVLFWRLFRDLSFY